MTMGKGGVGKIAAGALALAGRGYQACPTTSYTCSTGSPTRSGTHVLLVALGEATPVHEAARWLTFGGNIIENGTVSYRLAHACA